MAGAITALTIQQRNKERVNVYIDGEFALAVTAVTAAGLRRGQHLSDADIEKLKEEDQRDKAYNRAVRFLGFRVRSQAEMERYLRDKGYPADVVAETIDRLARQQYLNDEEFARAWLDNRERFRPRGQQALRYELRQKGVAADVIEAAVAAVDEDELAWAAVEGKLQRWQSLDEPALRQKMMGFLSRRGFNYEVIQRVVRRALQNDINTETA
jgi:regulatory protein